MIIPGQVVKLVIWQNDWFYYLAEGCHKNLYRIFFLLLKTIQDGFYNKIYEGQLM